MPGITVISCDNLQENGSKLAALLADFLERSDPELVRWVRRECAFPSTMVDRIVPATTNGVRADIAERIQRMGHGD
jgi:fructuronate reductase